MGAVFKSVATKETHKMLWVDSFSIISNHRSCGKPAISLGFKGGFLERRMPGKHGGTFHLNSLQGCESFQETRIETQGKQPALKRTMVERVVGINP